jgi:hypothetical protein
LNELESTDVIRRKTREQRVTVVEARGNNTTSNQISRRDCKVLPNVRKSPKMEISRPTNLSDMRIKGKGGVKSNSKNLCRLSQRNRRTSNRDSRLKGTIRGKKRSKRRKRRKSLRGRTNKKGF